MGKEIWIMLRYHMRNDKDRKRQRLLRSRVSTACDDSYDDHSHKKKGSRKESGEESSFEKFELLCTLPLSAHAGQVENMIKEELLYE